MLLLLWLLLHRLGVPGAWLAAALFAVHPVEVESVAWVIERKNTLSVLCYLASFLALLRFCGPSQGTGEGTSPRAALGVVCPGPAAVFGALLSKTAVCTLPAAFLLVRWWQQGRLGRLDLLISLPLFALGAGLALITIHVEKNHVGAHGAEWEQSPIEHLLIAGRAMWFYAGKLLWPTTLMFVYPRWEIDAGAWWQYLFPLTAVALVLGLWLLRHRLGRGPLVAVLFFGGTLVPVLGFFNVYFMRYSFVADHFQYLPSIGLLALFAAGLARLGSHFMGGSQVAHGLGGGGLLALLAALTWQQAAAYRDPLTKWSNILAKNPECWMAWVNRGCVHRDRGDMEQAIADLTRAIEVKADCVEAYNDRGEVFRELGRNQRAFDDFDHAVR